MKANLIPKAVMFAMFALNTGAYAEGFNLERISKAALDQANGAAEIKLTMPEPAAPAAEAKDNPCNRTEICIGDTVVDDNEDTGTVRMFFVNGMVRVYYARYGTEYTRHISKLSKSVGCNGGICVNAFVLDNDKDVGRVRMVFSNGMGKVYYSRYGTEYTKHVSELSKAVECTGGVCVNAVVLDNDKDVGMVRMVFANGMAKVYYSKYGTEYTRHVSELSKSVERNGGICVNAVVLDNDKDVGTVRMVFANGMAKVYYPRYGTEDTKHVSKLSCGGSTCCGQ